VINFETMNTINKQKGQKVEEIGK